MCYISASHEVAEKLGHGDLTVRGCLNRKNSSGSDWLHGGVAGEGHVLVGPDGLLVEVVLQDVQVLAEITDL